MRAVGPGPRSGWQAFVWWERRRLGYNALLLVVGAACLGAYATASWRATGALPPAGEVRALALVGVGIGNLAYTGGWLTETEYRRSLHGQPRSVLDDRLAPARWANQGVRLLMEAGLWATLIGAPAFTAWYAYATLSAS